MTDNPHTDAQLGGCAFRPRGKISTGEERFLTGADTVAAVLAHQRWRTLLSDCAGGRELIAVIGENGEMERLAADELERSKGLMRRRVSHRSAGADALTVSRFSLCPWQR